MERRLTKTEDGSMTIYVPHLDEHYHSIHGAATESELIFITAAFKQCLKESVRVLEFGMGSGLNVLLTYLESKKNNKRVFYHSIEKYALSSDEIEVLSKSELPQGANNAFMKIHDCPWETPNSISKSFCLYKEKSDFRDASPEGIFDVIYFDAFSPDVQPELWAATIFDSIFRLASPGAVLTTYSAKGTVKRNLIAAGFSIEKLPGPPGKREFIRARKGE